MIEHIDDILASDLLERYVLGDVSTEEAMKVESLRLEHAKVRDKLDELEKSLEKLSSENAIIPPKGTKECIIKNISGQTQEIPQSFQLNSISSGWKIAASFLIGGLAMWMWMQDSLNNANKMIDSQTTELSLLQEECEQVTRQYAFINNSSTVPVILEGTNNSPLSQVVVYWNERLEQSMMKVIELPSIKDDQTFQLWADVEGQMLSLGTFDAATAILNPIPMNYLADATSLNITIEPKGGSEHPTIATLTVSNTI